MQVMSQSPKVDRILLVNLDAFQVSEHNSIATYVAILTYKNKFLWQCVSYKYVAQRDISCPVDIIDVYTETIQQPWCDPYSNEPYLNTNSECLVTVLWIKSLLFVCVDICVVNYHGFKLSTDETTLDFCISKLTM